MKKEEYQHWPIYGEEKGPLKLGVAPEFGGRIIRLALDGYDFLFANQNLAGQDNIQPTAAYKGIWQNFGGDKVWPAPQGWANNEQWPGPPDPVLDGGVYAMQELQEGSILLTSPVDNFTGLQIRRQIRLCPDQCGVDINVFFQNTGKDNRRWSIWPVIQMNTSEEEEGVYRVTIPVKADSLYPQGFKVMHGLVNNPQFYRDGDHAVVDYKYLIGKIGCDSDTGWVACCNTRNGKVLVAEFTPGVDGLYPDNTSVQIWTQGRGMFYSRGNIRMLPDDRQTNPAYLEIELLSPFGQMAPGAEMQYNYRMRTCTIPAGGDVRNIKGYVAVSQPLKAEWWDQKIYISASYGFFTEGTLCLKDARNGTQIGGSWQVGPCRGLEVETILTEREALGIDTLILEFTTNQKKNFIIERIELCRI